jgi:hypothetical protein
MAGSMGVGPLTCVKSERGMSVSIHTTIKMKKREACPPSEFQAPLRWGTRGLPATAAAATTATAAASRSTFLAFRAAQGFQFPNGFLGFGFFHGSVLLYQGSS